MSQLRSSIEMDTKEPDSNDGYWSSCIRLIEKTFVPRRSKEGPCFEEEFQAYRATLNQNFQDILLILQHILAEHDESNISLSSPKVKIFKSYLIILIGEHQQKNPWTTTESIEASEHVEEILCNLFSCKSLSQLLEQNDDDITRVLTTLRPKLLKDTWKSYPAAVVCYKWFLSFMSKYAVVKYIGDIIPTTLIILDDFETEKQILGLECLSEILKHSSKEKKFVESGFAQMVLVNLRKFTYENKTRNFLLLYTCIEKVLEVIEFCSNSDGFEWNERDNFLEKLLDNMECEENLPRRQLYMTVLPGLLNSVGCYKWCKRVIRILKGYCEHYGDFKTLKITLENTKIILLRFQCRILVHCEALYSIFLKLYLDMIEAQIDEDTFKILEDCIYLVYEITPEIGKQILQNDQIQDLLVKSSRIEFVNRLSQVEVE